MHFRGSRKVACGIFLTCPFRRKYVALANPAWPPTQQRLNVIYATVARTIRYPNPTLKHQMLQVLSGQLVAFDTNYAAHLATQASFNHWHSTAIAAVTAVPFNWTNAQGNAYTTLTFGAAQKFLNLGLKDWWSLSRNGINPATPIDRLHGALDRAVYASTSRFCAQLRSLHNGNGRVRSYVYYLTPADYNTYQQHLQCLGVSLAAGLSISSPLKRIEVEQLLWGWI